MKYKLGTLLLFCLTLALTLLVYSINFRLAPKEEAFQQELAGRLAKSSTFQDKEIEWLGLEAYKDRYLLSFSVQQGRSLTGLAVFRRGFNHRYALSELWLSPRRFLGTNRLVMSGEDCLLLYGPLLVENAHKAFAIRPEGSLEILWSSYLDGKGLYVVEKSRYPLLFEAYESQPLRYELGGHIWLEGGVKEVEGQPGERYDLPVQSELSIYFWTLFTLFGGLLLTRACWEQNLQYQKKKERLLRRKRRGKGKGCAED